MADLDALDCSTFLDGDLDPLFGALSPRRAIGERVLRGWLTSKGEIEYDLSRGENVRLWLHKGMTPNEINGLANLLRMDALKDEGVVDCGVVVDLNYAQQKLVVRAEIEDDFGTFALTLAINAVTSEVLEASVTS